MGPVGFRLTIEEFIIEIGLRVLNEQPNLIGAGRPNIKAIWESCDPQRTKRGDTPAGFPINVVTTKFLRHGASPCPDLYSCDSSVSSINTIMDDFISFPPGGTLNIEIGDCVDVMKRFRDEGVMFDAILSDPPYGINLHGYGDIWDNGELVFNAGFWELCRDILKPGGYLIAFAAGRKYHRVATAIEDANFTLYPPLQWQFSGGLPKPANLSELFDRDNVKDRKIIGTKAGSGFTTANEKHGAQARNVKEFAVKERGVSPEAKQWDGYYYGVNALKPAQEPIVMAQKPIEEKRMIDSVRKHSVGALNIGEIKKRTGNWPTTVLEYAKASVKDHKSNHPSVKPIDLMQALCVMLCPPGGHILDPFAGTGTTGAAAIREGFDATVIEMNAEMEAVIRDRVNHRR